MTPQQQMAAKLAECGIPAKEIKCYGSQIMITAWSREAINRWVLLLSKFATVRSTVESIDECKVNKNSVMLPSVVKVWRVWATI